MNLESRRRLFTAASLALPVVLLSVYLVITRALRSVFSSDGDLVAIAVSVIAGAICAWRLVRESKWRFLAMSGYVLVGCAALLFYTLIFVCAVFSDCL